MSTKNNAVTILVFFIGLSFGYLLNNALINNHESIINHDKTEKDYFSQNQECFGLKNTLAQSVRQGNTDYWNERLIEVFYSPEFHECMYITETDDKIGFDSIGKKRLMRAATEPGTTWLKICQYVSFKSGQKDAISSSHLEEINKDNCAEFDKYIISIRR